MAGDFELGAIASPGGVRFRVWAPKARRVSVEPAGPGAARPVPLRRSGSGYFEGTVRGLGAGDRYVYVLDGRDRVPDPASRFQPLGVHGPSEIVDPGAYVWDDKDWSGLPMSGLIIYEIHIGTFTREGTFRAAIPRLASLKKLGVTAVELMPVAQFPGERNWGYDGVFPYAPQNSYGGPRGLQAFVEACHEKGLAVLLDVVYNHLGPEGNYLERYGPYFSDRCRTPWGPAMNLDGPWSDEVRRFFIANAVAWVRDYHIDGLRLDAIQGLSDSSAWPFLRDLSAAVHGLGEELGRRVLIIGESDLNDTRVIRPLEADGFGLDGLWNDDFHHALHGLLTGERTGYYQDFGSMRHLVKALREGFVYSGQYSRFRKHRRGTSSAERPAHQFIVFSQNHDQVGNRPAGDRPALRRSPGKLELAAGLVLLAPYVPLLFMGEEYGEDKPFLYFVSYADEKLAAAVAEGRRAELGWTARRARRVDPREERTFLRSKLDWRSRTSGRNRDLLDFYRRLIGLRKSLPALAALRKENLEVKVVGSRVLSMRRWLDREEVLCLFNLTPRTRNVQRLVPPGRWRLVLDSSARAPESPVTAASLPAWGFRVYRSSTAGSGRR